jgi:FKBP-type peptidyl-prolyl cis-trans isomerase SlyD
VFFEKTEKENPFTFLYGTGSLLPDFENNISGLKSGDSFDFSIAYDEAYGDYDEEKVVSVPKTAFKVDGKMNEDIIRMGNVIPMQDSEGNHLQGEIVGIDFSSVQMDFNHPLAGMDLYFKGEIVEVRDAQPEELEHGHVHGPGGHHH